MESDFPRDYDFMKRREISKGTELLSTEERNELLLKKCKKAASLMEEYNTGNRSHKMDWIKHEINYINCVRGIDNKFVENQISRLTFEIQQLEGVTVYLGDPRGLKIATTSIGRILISLIEELEGEK